MILQTGTSEEKLFDVLQRIDDMTKIDSVVPKSSKIRVNVMKGKKWEVRTNSPEHKDRLIRKGRSYNALFDTLSHLYQESTFSTMDAEVSVLCYMSTKPEKEWDGKIRSSWIRLSLGIPYAVEDGKVVFDTIKLSMAPEDYVSMMECGLALCIGDGEVVYPFTKESLPSLGRFLDCESAFKQMDEYPLGSAIVVANKLCTKKSVTVLARNTDGFVRPLRSLCGSKYVYVPQTEFFRTVFDQCAGLGVYTIDQWTVTDQLTTADIRFINRDMGIVASTSDLSTAAMGVTAYALVDGVKVELKHNSRAHVCRPDGNELFAGLHDAYMAFEKRLKGLSGVTVAYTPAMLTPLMGCLGKKRMGSVDIAPGEYPGDVLFRNIIRGTYFRLAPKQARELARGYKTILDMMTGGVADA